MSGGPEPSLVKAMRVLSREVAIPFTPKVLIGLASSLGRSMTAATSATATTVEIVASSVVRRRRPESIVSTPALELGLAITTSYHNVHHSTCRDVWLTRQTGRVAHNCRVPRPYRLSLAIGWETPHGVGRWPGQRILRNPKSGARSTLGEAEGLSGGCLFHPLARPGRDNRRCHRDLVILAPGWPDGPPQLEEVGFEVLDAQRLAGCIKHLLRVVPVDGPTARLGRGGQGLAVHHPVGNVPRSVVLDSLGNRGRKLRALAKGDTTDTRHRHGDGVQG